MSEAQYNIDLATRQLEINEWAYQSKMETLFVFQIIFVALTFLAVLIYAVKRGWLNAYFVFYVAVILFFIVAVILARRISYSQNARNDRVWSRQNFGQMRAP